MEFLQPTTVKYDWSNREVGESFAILGDPNVLHNRVWASFCGWKKRWLIEHEDYQIKTKHINGGLEVRRVK